MTDRITKHVSNMLEYGRKPYLVTKDAIPYGEKADYRYMMDTTWQKMQDDNHIVVQSVRKKPYKNADYQTMENEANGFTGIDWSMYYFPNLNWNYSTLQPVLQPVLPPEDPDREEQERVDKKLSWSQCPVTVGLSKSYNIVVANSYTINRTYRNGRLQSQTKTYKPTTIWVEPKTTASKGLSITFTKNLGSATLATLSTSSFATGEYYIYASDGANRIEKTILVSSKESTIFLTKGFTGSAYKLKDLIDGNEIPYDIYTTQLGIFKTALSGYELGSYTADNYGSWVEYNEQHAAYLDDDTFLGSYGWIKQYYYECDASGDVISLSFFSTDGVFYQTTSPQVFYRGNARGNNTWESAVGTSYVWYYKYPGGALREAIGDYSITQTGDGITISYYQNTGKYLTRVRYIDGASFVEQWVIESYSGTSTPPASAYFMGALSGVSFAFETDNNLWVIRFGSL